MKTGIGRRLHVVASVLAVAIGLVVGANVAGRLASPASAAGVRKVTINSLPLATSAAASSRAARVRCGRVSAHARHAPAKVLIVRGPASCVVARALIADAFTAEVKRHYDFLDPTYGIGWRVDGWRCTTGLADTQTFCMRGDDRTDGSLRSDDGWNF